MTLEDRSPYRMSAMKVIYFLILATFSSWASEDSGWYTIGNKDFFRLEKDLPELRPVAGNDGLTILKLNSKEVENLSGLIHERLGKCGGFKAHDSLEEAKAALLKPIANKSFHKSLVDYSINQQEIIAPALLQVSETEIRRTILKLSDFQTRHFKSQSGVQSSLFIKDMWTELTKHRSDVKVDVITNWRYPQPSIILTIVGSELPEEIIVLGGHADSISYHHGDRSPGADDNASGIASITEVIRMVMVNNIQPKRTIQFMAYAAEEVGLLGSDEIAKSYKQSSKNVIGVMQLDMTLFKGTSDKDIVLIADETNRKQNEFVSKLIDEYVKVPWGYSFCGYGCSDHASWTDAGFASSFPFEAKFEDINQHIHTADDTLESAGGNALHSVKFTKLATAYVIELAN